MPNKRGYLNCNYKLFHISDKRDVDFESHSHDFDKIIICLSGSVSYAIEGKTYTVRQGDMLLVPMGKIHKSRLTSTEKYERVVFWIDDAYLRDFAEDGNSLATCFDMVDLSGMCGLRPEKDSFASMLRCITSIENLKNSHLFGKTIEQNALFNEFMVIVNRLVFEQKPDADSYKSDPKFDGILDYINKNLSADLSVERLSEKYYLSKSYFMMRFKELTGCSVHEYIIQKRLNRAVELIKSGSNVNTASAESGFSDYTVFYRNFKKNFGISPAQLLKK